MINRYCRVCGLDHYPAPLRDERGVPSYEICECCGMEAGYEDDSLEAARSYREEWLRNVAKWFKLHLKPENWDLEEQLKNIPEEFR